MGHSHLPINHLLKRVEIYSARRAARDVRPEWITRLVDDVADLFEPLAGMGRVGFDCRLTEERWIVAMFLGATEQVGGPQDGEFHLADFDFDLARLTDRFTEIDRFCWNVTSQGDDSREEPADAVLASPGRSIIAVEGSIDGNSLRLEIHSVPPADAGPGFHSFPDGRSEPA